MRLWLALLLAALPAAAAERALPAVEAPAALSRTAEPPADGLAPPATLALPDAAPLAADAPASAVSGETASAQAGPAETAAAASPAGLLSARAASEDAGRFHDAKLRIIHVAAELTPFVKKGGLGEVASLLARQQAALGHDVTNIVPMSASFKAEGVDFQPLPVTLPLRVGDRVVETRVSMARKDGVRILRLENELFDGREVYDNHEAGERFIALPRAALEAASALGLQPDVFHFHDWHTALGAPMLKLPLAQPVDPALKKAAVVVTAHNAGYPFQGWFPPDYAAKAGFSKDDFRWDRLAHKDHLNFLKAGFQYADAITTVSLNHRHELLQSAAELEALLRHRADRFFGFPNPVNPDLHPSRDPVIYENYGLADAIEGKAINKERLQAELGLPRRDVPLFVVASRLTKEQKGLDMILAVAPEIAAKGGQLAVVGVGEADVVSELAELQRRYPENIVFKNEFSALARKLYAGGDFLLMPSRYEPGGLSNAEAQAYGAKPIVTPVGGMVDRTLDIRRHPEGDGFLLSEVSAESLGWAVEAAFHHFQNKPALERTTRNAMRHDRSWDGVREYLALYRRLLTLAP